MNRLTLKELLAMRKPYPYEKVASELNNLEDLSQVDRIVATGEKDSCNMVGIRKLYKMVKNERIKEKMREIYGL